MSQPPRMAPRPNRKTRPLMAREPMLRRPSPPRADTTSNTPPIKARTKAKSDSSLGIFKGIFNLMIPKNPPDPDNNSTDLNKGKPIILDQRKSPVRRGRKGALMRRETRSLRPPLPFSGENFLP